MLLLHHHTHTPSLLTTFKASLNNPTLLSPIRVSLPSRPQIRSLSIMVGPSTSLPTRASISHVLFDMDGLLLGINLYPISFLLLFVSFYVLHCQIGLPHVTKLLLFYTLSFYATRIEQYTLCVHDIYPMCHEFFGSTIWL